MSPTLAPADRIELRLIRRHRDRGDRKAFAELLRRNTPQVRALARTFATTPDELDAFVRSGTAGLVEAIDAFDLDRGTRFSPFAARAIASAMQRSIAARTGGASPLRLVRAPDDAADRAATRGNVGTRDPQAGPTLDGRLPRLVQFR